MIKLKENNHIDEKLLESTEAKIFIIHLEMEKQRHMIEMHIARKYYTIYYIKNSILELTFWKCQLENHQDDVIKIEKVIRYLKDKWGFE